MLGPLHLPVSMKFGPNDLLVAVPVASLYLTVALPGIEFELSWYRLYCLPLSMNWITPLLEKSRSLAYSARLSSWAAETRTLKPSLSISPQPLEIDTLELCPPLLLGELKVPSTIRSVWFFFRMKLTTPAIASEPYSVLAPSVMISTRSTAASGMLARLTVEPEVAGARRRPFNSTRV